MFNSLKNLPEPKTSDKPKMANGMSLRAFRAAHKQMELISKINLSLSHVKDVVGDFADLRRLKSVARTQGLNKALAVFVNPGNNVISKIVKDFPSNESLDAVSIGKSDRRTKAAIEGMSQSLNEEPQLISDWTRSSGDDVQQLLSSVDDQLKDVGGAISHYLETIEVGTDATVFDFSKIVEISSYAAACARFDALLEVLPDMDALVSDPTDRDQMDIYKAKIASLIEKVGPVAGLGIDPDNQCLVITAPKADDYIVQSSSLSDLGYTVENTVELLKKADQLADEISGLVERKEQMTAHFHATADVITQIDNTVPPAVDNAISEDEDGDDTESSYGVTQADVYHAQVSSHLCCLSVIVCVSLSAIQEVLIIANELSEDISEDGGDPTIDPLVE